MMEFDGEFDSTHSPEELWNYFTDPDVLAECAPGCEEMRQVSDSEVEATLSVGVGSVKPTFDATMIVTAADRPTHLEMTASGEAARNSFEGVASMRLDPDGDGGTNASWTATADVSGLIASLGQRALGGVVSKLVTDFFADVDALADEGVSAESSLTAAEDVDAEI